MTSRLSHFIPLPEERKRSRLPLHLPVILCAPGSHAAPSWTKTVDIGDEGFSCTTPEPFRLGDRLQCLIALPSPCSSAISEQLYLRGEVQVVRLAVNQEEGFSVYCQFSDYHMINGEAVNSWMASPGTSV